MDHLGLLPAHEPREPYEEPRQVPPAFLFRGAHRYSGAAQLTFQRSANVERNDQHPVTPGVEARSQVDELAFGAAGVQGPGEKDDLQGRASPCLRVSGKYELVVTEPAAAGLELI